MMVELPVLNSDNLFEEAALTDDYEYMGLKTTENDVENFYLIGTGNDPIESSLAFDLPELEVSLMNKIEENVTININQNNNIITKTIPFPKLHFGSVNNKLNLTIENTGNNPIENLTIEIWDKGSNKTTPLISKQYNNVANSITKNLYFNNKEITTKDLELKLKYEQSSDTTTANIILDGLKKVTVKKVKDLEYENLDLTKFTDIENILLEIGIFDQISKYNNHQAKIKTYLTKPENTNLEFNIDNITINNRSGENKGEYYLWQDDIIDLGYLDIASSVKLNSNKLTYDSTEAIDVKVKINGKAEITSTNDFYEKYSDKIRVEDGDVLYTTPPMKVDISQKDISAFTNNNIDHKETYFEAEINNLTGVELKGDIYMANTSINLFKDENKVNLTKIEINNGENLIKRFLLEEIFDHVKITLTSEDIYLGFKIKAGDFSTNKGITIEFTDKSILDIKSSVFVKLKVNQ